MSTPAIKTRVSIEGEKEYKAALAEINSGLRVLNSEMKLTSTQFAENADGMDALAAKSDILERQILSQNEKIETLKSALQNSAEAFGQSDKRTSAWTVSLNNAEAELVKMERELRDNREAMEQAGKAAEENDTIFSKLSNIFGGTEDSAKGLGDMADDLAGKLGINLPDGAKEALNAMGDVNAQTALLAGGAAAAAAAIAEIEKALIGLTSDRAAAATELANIAETINMDVEATQQWDYVLKTVGSSIGEAQGDLSAFQERIMDAATGTGEAAEMFAKLGVNVIDQNGALRDTESVLLDTVHALQLMADETERNAISSTLLGGTGEKLIPIYNQSAESLDYLLEKKKELGILTGDEIEALKDVSEALLDYEERATSAKDTIAAEFAPALEEFYNIAGVGLQGLGESAEKSGLVNFFGSILELVSALAPAFGLLGSAVELLEPVFDGFSIALGIVADGLNIVVSLAAALADLLTLDFAGAGKNWDNVMSIFSGNSATERSFVNAINSSGNANFAGGYTWVGENGPELAYLPQGTRIFNNQESRELGGDVFYVTIDAKNVREFNDIVAMAQAKRRTERMEVAK